MAAGAQEYPLCRAAQLGATQSEEALETLREAAQAYLEDMVEAGDFNPDEGLGIGGAPAVTVTL